MPRELVTPQSNTIFNTRFRGMSVPQMRSASPLPYEAGRLIDEAVVNVGVNRLNVFAEISTRVPVQRIANPIGTTFLSREKISRTGTAKRTMLPGSNLGERGKADRDNTSVPIFWNTEFFSYNVRELEAAAMGGVQLDIEKVSSATRNLNELTEDQSILGLGSGVTMGGHSAPGLLTAPGLNTIAYASNESWLAPGHTGPVIVADVEAFINALQAANRFGPYHLFVNGPYGTKIGVEDYSAAKGDDTIRERLEKINTGNGPLTISVADQLPTDRTIMVDLTAQSADAVIGQPPVAVSWVEGSGWEVNFMVMSCALLRVDDDYEGNSGIAAGDLN